MSRIDAAARLICLSTFALSSASVLGQGALLWSDEFDGTSLNMNNWSYQIGNGDAYGVSGWGNNELEYYTDRTDNLYVSGGYLHIIARQENYAGFNYTSGRIRSANKQEFLYGRIEARMKLPQGAGIWPAFWMLPTNSPYGGWASSGEIDIMEAVNVPWTVHGTIHHGGSYPNNTSNGASYSDGSNFANAFHTYTLEWEEDVMRWYVDGNLFQTLTSGVWWSSSAPDNDRAPFDQPFHLLLNVAVGGNWPGPPNASTSWPQEMLVDWVRVYDLNNSRPTVTLTSPNDGDVHEVGDITIACTAEDADGSIDRVEFYVNDNLIFEDTAAPYETIWSATDGCYSIEAVAYDDLNTPATDTVSIKVGAGCVGIPFNGSPIALPGTVEMEYYDIGGEGVAYHDCDTDNNGGAYRDDEGVDLEVASEGGYNVGWMCVGEWLNYAVDVTQPGLYTLEARVASTGDSGVFRLEIDREDVSGDLWVPDTDGWQEWTTISTTVDLPYGEHELRFANAGSGEFNISFLTFDKLNDLDFDQDGDVDLTDYMNFGRCLTGPDGTTPQSVCSTENYGRSDVDNDGDIDLADYAEFQRSRTIP